MLVSAFAFGGVPGLVVRKVFKEADIYVSPALLYDCLYYGFIKGAGLHPFDVAQGRHQLWHQSPHGIRLVEGRQKKRHQDDRN